MKIQSFISHPITINTSLAVAIGLEGAIIVQEIQTQIVMFKTTISTEAWIKKSIEHWQEEFPFWTEHKIRKILNQLVKNNILFTESFGVTLPDTTLYYRINYESLLLQGKV